MATFDSSKDEDEDDIQHVLKDVEITSKALG